MTAPSLLDELEGIVRLADKATPGEWRTLYRKCGSPHQDFPDYAQEVFDEAGATIAQLAWHAVQINATTMATDREPNAKLIASAVNFIRAHHAEIADMAKRLEAAERDAAELRMCKGEYAMPDGTIARCHVNVGVNVWHGERWLAFHECSPDQLRLIIDAAAQEGEG